MSIFALDYDDTYTLDPEFWDKFIKLARKAEHEVYCVTMRRPKERIPPGGPDCPIIYTSRKAKEDFCYHEGIQIDVWIDDSPYLILNDAFGY